jgi:hypothetical protein
MGARGRPGESVALNQHDLTASGFTDGELTNMLRNTRLDTNTEVRRRYLTEAVGHFRRFLRTNDRSALVTSISALDRANAGSPTHMPLRFPGNT